MERPMPPRMSSMRVTRQLASFLSLMLTRFIRFFVYSQTWRCFFPHFGRNWLDSCHFRAKLRVFTGRCLWGDETGDWRIGDGGGIVEGVMVVEYPSNID